jgi:hypothetical protein
MDQVAKGLNGSDHPPHRLRLISGRDLNLPHDLPNRPAQFAQQAPVEANDIP